MRSKTRKGFIKDITVKPPTNTPGVRYCKSFIDSRYGLGHKVWIKEEVNNVLRYRFHAVYNRECTEECCACFCVTMRGGIIERQCLRGDFKIQD